MSAIAIRAASTPTCFQVEAGASQVRIHSRRRDAAAGLRDPRVDDRIDRAAIARCPGRRPRRTLAASRSRWPEPSCTFAAPSRRWRWPPFCAHCAAPDDGPSAGNRVWLAAGVSDMRSSIDLLAARVQTTLQADPFSGHVFAFRGRRGDLIKLLWSEGDGMHLFIKRLERGRFVWPQAHSGSVAFSSAQLSMLLEGIDWRQPQRTWQPSMTV